MIYIKINFVKINKYISFNIEFLTFSIVFFFNLQSIDL